MSAQTATCRQKPWLQHYDSDVPPEVDFEAICLPEMLDRTVTRIPDKMALLFQGYKVPYHRLKEMVDRFATCLEGFGIQKGDAVAILLPNTIACVVSFFAILKIGAVAVMNNPLYADRELEHQFNDSGAKALITLDLLANRMIDLRSRTGIRHIMVSSLGDYLPFPKNLLFPLVARRKKLTGPVKSAGNVYRWKSLLSSTDARPCHVSLSFEDPALYQYTGGTTGVSKAAILTHGNLSCQVQQLRAWFPEFSRSYEIMLGALPFFHVFGLSTAMNFAVCMGWGNVLVPKPQPDPLLEAITRYKPTFAPLVPTMYIGILNHPHIERTDLTSIAGCFSGSAPLPIEVIRDFEDKTSAVIVEGFGLTEATPVTHINPFGGRRKPGSVGLPICNTDCRIISLQDGRSDVAVGESGELLVRGPQVMRGYLNKADETALALEDGWLHTGDIARMDQEGYFYIVDRKKDMIICSGYNVYPRDIEEVFFAHPDVLEAAAIGVPHPSRGEEVKVFVVLKKERSLTEQDLIEYCQDKLATYKLPRQIEFREELPKSNVGKVLKKELRTINAGGERVK